MKRSSGVLLHITSLPSPYGIGTLGKNAHEFVDLLRECGHKYWQVLPINPVGYGNSPYQSYCAFAGEPLLIDLDDLVANGLLSKSKCEEADFGADESFVDFEKVIRVKMKLLNEAFESFKEDVGYLAFIKEEAAWLDNYALFMAIKEANGNVAFTQWEKNIRSYEDKAVANAMDEYDRRVRFFKFTQYVFRRQWAQLRRYANKNGIKIIGDIPIYASGDSVDVWTNPELFLLDDERKPVKVAGVPPDYFSKTGQLWGNPIYDWVEMKKDGYLWWLERFKKAADLFDTIRIDHFRAFDTYYTIDSSEKTAVNGKWQTGPGMDLFNAVRSKKEKALEGLEIIAEDLGELFDSVKVLLEQTGFPGMKILQFGFNPDNQDNEHLPHNYSTNMVVYTGTHDNSTIKGYLNSADKSTRNMAMNYLKPRIFEGVNWACIRSLYASNAAMVLIPMQDILALDDRGRMNTPGTIGGSNWIWRWKGRISKSAIKKLKLLSEVYFR
jgi:4-alpha-glucanotransferase